MSKDAQQVIISVLAKTIVRFSGTETAAEILRKMYAFEYAIYYKINRKA